MECLRGGDGEIWVCGGDRKFAWRSTEGSGNREFVWQSTNATCNCQVPYGDRSHLFRLAAVLGSKVPRQVPAVSNVP